MIRRVVGVLHLPPRPGATPNKKGVCVSRTPHSPLLLLTVRPAGRPTSTTTTSATTK